jgi:nitroreductase
MKYLFCLIMISGLFGALSAQELKPIALMKPDKTRGLPVMEALSVRASVREWSSKPLSMQDLSDLLWAANGINRPDGKRTASSAQNAQDIDIYVFMEEGIYLYNAPENRLNPVAAGDYRDLPGKTDAPVNLVLVTDISKFRGPGDPPPAGGRPGTPPAGTPPPAGGPPPNAVKMTPDQVDSLKLGWGNIDCGIVSQNISLFCAATGIKTRPRASFPGAAKIRELLTLKPTQHILLNHPVGYAKEE